MELARILKTLRTARSDGIAVRDWSIHVADSQRLALGIKDRQTGNAHAPLTLQRACSARYLMVWEDGLVSQGGLERRQIEHETGDALAYARAAAHDDPDAAQVLGPAAIPEVELYDPDAAAVARGESLFVAGRLRHVRERIAAEAFGTWSGSFQASEVRSRLVTSAGLDLTGEGTSLSWFVTLDGEIGDGFGARKAEPDADFERRLQRLIETAKRLREPAARMDGGVVPVLLHPRVVEQYVLETLLHHLGGATIDHGEGRFRRDQFGADHPVLREDIDLRLDPLQPFRWGSYRFTAEGLPAARCSFIESGRLVQPILDLKYARRLGLPPTPIPYSNDVLAFGTGERLSLPRALERAAGGAFVLSVLGVHTQDSASGDFSLSAPQVLRLGGPGYAGRTRGTLSGNLFAVLRDEALRFVEFEDEPTPGLLFPCRFDPS